DSVGADRTIDDCEHVERVNLPDLLTADAGIVAQAARRARRRPAFTPDLQAGFHRALTWGGRRRRRGCFGSFGDDRLDEVFRRVAFNRPAFRPLIAHAPPEKAAFTGRSFKHVEDRAA